MRVDFYQLGAELPERAIPLLAAKARQAGERLLVVSGQESQLRAIGDALWAETQPEFLANGIAGGDHDARQPILLSKSCEATNGARLVMFADGEWRDDALGDLKTGVGEAPFTRAFLLFGDAALQGARACWRMLGEHETVERRFWKLENGKWREGP